MLLQAYFARIVLPIWLFSTAFTLLSSTLGSLQPDPGQLIFWSRRENRLFVVDAQRLVLAPLIKPPQILIVDIPKLSQNGQRAAFEISEDGHLQIRVMDTHFNTLYATIPEAEDRLPALSPDGRSVAFWSSRPRISLNQRFQNWHLYILDLNHSALKQITSEMAIIPYDSPRWSPDGTWIIVQFWKAGGDAGTFLVDTQTGALQSIRSYVDTGADLAWSPDSKQIAFRTARDRNPEVYVLNLENSDIQNLTHHPAQDFQPVWSPDKKHIAFVSTRDNVGAIYVMDADGGNVRRLSHIGGWQPSWSPNGNYLSFISEDDNQYGLYIIRSDGTNLHRVLNVSEVLIFVGWYI